jgi:SAM-dependent methyltransferase
VATDGPAGERREAAAAPSVERFLGEPTRDLADWRWLWDGDHRFPIRSHRGLLGRLLVLAKRALRPFTTVPQADLWERQRIFNLIVLENLQRAEEHGARLAQLEGYWREGLAEVMDHNDALFALADQRLDRMLRETRDVWGRLGSALARIEVSDVERASALRAEQAYLEFERRFRGTEEEIGERLAAYVPRLSGRGAVLDLGCGRGEALAALAAAGIEARGIDGSETMVEECRRKGLRAERADLIATLEAEPEGSLGAIVSFHVIEHLPPATLDRMVRLAWRALSPGGMLILETPNPLSVVVAARNFWIDPSHVRPVHPATLEELFRASGFDGVERLELLPFPAAERLPELTLEGLAPEARELAQRVNELRDRLDDLLFGAQDYAVLGVRPEA